MSAKKSSVKVKRERHAAPRLKDRRRQGRRRHALAFLLALIALLAFVLWGLNQSALRISSVELRGADNLLPGADPIVAAKDALKGKYLGVIPRDSTLLFPEHDMRVAVLSAHPEIAALTFNRRGLTGIVMKASLHTAVGRWCGLTPTPGVTPYCYFYNPNGFIYAAAPEPLRGDSASASSTNVSAPARNQPSDAKTMNSFDLYAPLVDNAQPALPGNSGRAGGEPFRATIIRADSLPDAAALARQMASFGSEVSAIVIREDEADLMLASGTRITYVLGHEQETFSALTSAATGLTLANGSVEYVDLRFSGKVYFKKKGE